MKVVTLSQDGCLTIWLIENGQKLKTFPDLHASNGELTALEFDDLGTRFYTGSSDGLVRVWDFNGHCYHTLEANEIDQSESNSGGDCNNYEIFTDTGHKKAYSGYGLEEETDGMARRNNASGTSESSEWKCVREEHDDDIFCAATMRTQPMFLVTGAFDGDIVVWNSVTEQPYKHLSARKRIPNTHLAKKEVNL